MQYDSRATVLATICRENKISDIRTNVVRHSHECLATVVRMKMKLKLHSWERRETISRISRDCHTTVARLSSDSPEIHFQNSRITFINSRITFIKSIQGDCNDVTRDVRTNLCNTTFTFSLIYFALSDARRCQVI